MSDWTFVDSGILGSALDLGIVSGAMRNKTSSDASALRLVMMAPQGWPSWAAGATGAQVQGQTLTWEWRLPWLGTGASSLDASPFSPATDALIQNTLMTSGQVDWALYEQTSGSLGVINNIPLVGTAAQNVNNAAQDATSAAVGQTLDSLTSGNVPWVPIVIGAGLILLVIKEL